MGSSTGSVGYDGGIAGFTVNTDGSYSIFCDPLSLGPRYGRKYDEYSNYVGWYVGWDFQVLEVTIDNSLNVSATLDFQVVTFGQTITIDGTSTPPGMVQRSTVSSGALGTWPGKPNPEPAIIERGYEKTPNDYMADKMTPAKQASLDFAKHMEGVRFSIPSPRPTYVEPGFYDPLEYKIPIPRPTYVEPGFYDAKAGTGVMCFPSETSITLADGATKNINLIQPNDIVLACDQNGVLKPARVIRLFENLTQEWVKLTLHGTIDENTGSNRVLVTTPGHHFFDIRTNSHMHISEMLKRDGGETRLTLEKGEIVRVTAESILYSADTADMFEQAEMLVTHTEHGLALKPEMRKGWKTYNFEVEKYHTYIAGGVRVHNTSAHSKGYVDNGAYVGSGVLSTEAVWSGKALGFENTQGKNPYAVSFGYDGVVVERDRDTGWVHSHNPVHDVTTITTPTGMMAIDHSSGRTELR